jgi:hypothetical protein
MKKENRRSLCSNLRWPIDPTLETKLARPEFNLRNICWRPLRLLVLRRGSFACELSAKGASHLHIIFRLDLDLWIEEAFWDPA